MTVEKPKPKQLLPPITIVLVLVVVLLLQSEGP